ncbi:metallophosphoesterase family protein [Candidatus Omnitrophota bacterium]
MKIGVISDTHIPTQAQDIAPEVYEAFSGVDLILHAGDLVQLSVLESLKNIAPVRAVYGNMDTPAVRAVLPVKDIIQCENFTIGLMHGYGSAHNLEEKVASEFQEKVDVIVFGHSHKAVNETRGWILYFNPGSPTDDTFAEFKSFGILEIEKKITGQIIKIES